MNWHFDEKRLKFLITDANEKNSERFHVVGFVRESSEEDENSRRAMSHCKKILKRRTSHSSCCLVVLHNLSKNDSPMI